MNAVGLYHSFLSFHARITTPGTGYTRKYSLPLVQVTTSLLGTVNCNGAVSSYAQSNATTTQCVIY